MLVHKRVVSLSRTVGPNGTDFDFLVNELAKDSHHSWCRRKQEERYQYGEVLDKEKKLHYLLLPFDILGTPRDGVSQHLLVSSLSCRSP